MIGLDRHVEHVVVLHRVGWLDWLFVGLSRIGAYGLVWLGLGALAAWLWHRRVIFPLVLAADAIAEGLAGLGKFVFDRRRPHLDPLMQVPQTPSLPSGHAATSFACAATLARYAPRRIAVPLYVLAALIAFSRVYVGLHYPLDVIAGAVLGLAVATALRLLPAVPRRSPRAPQAG